MRLWSIHPRHLDSKGLVALWREALLAKKVLENKTKGYKNHPQLSRFKESGNGLDCINQYLAAVYLESVNRGYNFNRNKISLDNHPRTLLVTSGQVKYETKHLKQKLKKRDPDWLIRLANKTELDVHPLFIIKEGPVETWEKIQ